MANTDPNSGDQPASARAEANAAAQKAALEEELTFQKARGNKDRTKAVEAELKALKDAPADTGLVESTAFEAPEKAVKPRPRTRKATAKKR